MSRKTYSAATACLVGGILVLIGVGLWRTHDRGPVAVSLAGDRLMGTKWHMTAVAPPALKRQAQAALADAERAARQLEALMSVHLDDSEISRFNAAPPQAPFPLTADTLTVLSLARKYAEQTDGAFDVTCYPLVRLWSSAGASGPPGADQIAEALRPVGYEKLRFDRDGVTKTVEGVQVDLGGIAKGYAVDRAALKVQQAGFSAGLVNLGGNIRCFGPSPSGGKWVVGIRHPFDKQAQCGYLQLGDAAVATSGDYERYHEIAGRRYSHILDPRSGRPVELVPSVTVVSLATASAPPSATEADAWSTGLSVLGPAGLERLKAHPGLEAMMIVGTPERHAVHMTSGFAALLEPGTKIALE